MTGPATTRDNRAPMWRIDPRSGALVDAQSGRSFNSGDAVVVKIAAVDLPRRSLDLVLDDPASRAAGKKKVLKDPVGGLGIGGGIGGGIGSGGGAGFGSQRTGGQRRSQKSKSRDKGKTDHRRGK